MSVKEAPPLVVYLVRGTELNLVKYRWAYSWIVCAGAALAAFVVQPELPPPPGPRAGAKEPAPPKAPKAEDVRLVPNAHLVLSVAYLQSLVRAAGADGVVTPEEKETIESQRFLSFQAVPGPDGEDITLDDIHRLTNWWVQQLSLNPKATSFQFVPGSFGRLAVIDIRDYNWNAGAFSAVARREPYHRLPGFDPVLAATMLSLLNLEQDPKTFHLEGIVRADWFFRETIELERSSAYHDLIFARQRFVVEGGDKAGREFVRLADGRWGWRTKKAPVNGNFRFVDFPKTLKDIDAAFGVSDQRAFFREQRIDPRFGEVSLGHRDASRARKRKDPFAKKEKFTRSGSMVTRNNRFLEFIPISTRVASMAFVTYDVDETAGEQDFSEQFPAAFKKAGELSIKFKAREHLYGLPNGGQFGALSDVNDKVLTVADNKFAGEREDPTDTRVRTMGSCVWCHAKENGFIMPFGRVRQMKRAGVKFNVLDRNLYNQLENYFFGWDDEVELFRHSYRTLLGKMTGWDGAKLAEKFRAYQLWYDDAVFIDQAATELGWTEGLLVEVADLTGSAQAAALARGLEVPRRTWELDLYAKFRNALEAYREHPKVARELQKMAKLRR